MGTVAVEDRPRPLAFFLAACVRWRSFSRFLHRLTGEIALSALILLLLLRPRA